MNTLNNNENNNSNFESESERKFHISRLPSASLLRSNIRCETPTRWSSSKHSEFSSSEKSARLILAQLKENASAPFQAAWKKNASKYPSARLQMFNGVSDNSILMICSSNAKLTSSPGTDSGISTLPSTPGLDSPAFSPAHSVGQTAGPEHDKEDSATDNMYSDDARGLDTVVASLLTSLGVYFQDPPQVQHCMDLLNDQSGFMPVVCVTRLQIGSKDNQEPLSSLVTNLLKWKFEDKNGSPKKCDTNNSDHIHDLVKSVQEETGCKMALQLYEDLSDPSFFTVIYLFRKEEDVIGVRRCDSWRSWRKFMAPLLLGSPTTEHMISNYHWSDDSLDEEAAAKKHQERLLESPKAISGPPLRFESPSQEGLPHGAADMAVQHNPKFAPYAEFIQKRFLYYVEKRDLILGGSYLGLTTPKSIAEFGNGHLHFGLNRCQTPQPGWRFRDYMPGAKSVNLMGDFNNWSTESHSLSRDESYGDGVWSIFIPDTSSGSVIHKCSKYKLYCKREDDSEFYRVPSYAKYLVENQDMKTWDAMVITEDEVPNAFEWKHKNPIHKISPKIYEVFPGMTDSENVGTWKSVKENILHRMIVSGFNTLLLRSVQEFECYSSAGWHVNSFFATSSRYGSTVELKELIDQAHGMGIKVLFSIIHSHVGPYEGTGLAHYDGTKTGGLTRFDDRAYQKQWDSIIPDFGKPEVIRMLLSSFGYFLSEFKVDGFRMEGVTSMIYQNHGIMTQFDKNEFGTFFNSNIDMDASAYLMLANDLIHKMCHTALTIANDHTRHPGLSLPIEEGGLGFSYAYDSHQTDSLSIAGKVSWKADYSLHDLVSAFESINVGKTISVVDSFDSNVIGRRPLKVAMFAWETLHTLAVGGVAPHVTELAAALARQGHEIHIFTRSTTLGVNHTIHYGVHYHECPFTLSPDFVSEINNMCESFIHQLSLAEQYMQSGFDICHAHDWLAGRALVIAKRLGKKCVFTMHSTEFGRCGNCSYGGQSARIRGIENEACSAADRVICVSGVLATEVRDLYHIHPDKIRVCYNGCDVGTFEGFVDAAPIKANYNIGALEPMFLFVGRLAVQKGPDLLIEAIPQILKARGDVKFVIVGDGHMKSQLETRVAQLGIGHAVRLVGSKSGGELYSLYKICDAVIVPSRNEPFGIVVLEAWAAFKPVVATTCGGPRDFVTPNENGYLVDPNPSSIAWGCCEILNDFGKARWMGEVAHEKALREFSWSHIALKTRDIYLTQICKADAAYCESTRGDASLIQQVIGSDIFEHMAIFDPCQKVREGLGFMKIAKIMALFLGSNGFSAFMGSEFGHPDSVDLPRASNQFTNFYARRQWHLATDKQLKYKHLLFFTRCIMETCDLLGVHFEEPAKILCVHEADRIVAFQRGCCVVILNLHPSASRQDYVVEHSIQTKASSFCLLINTDSPVFGGSGQLVERSVSEGVDQFKRFDNNGTSLTVRIPSMSGLLLIPSDSEKIQLFNKCVLLEDPDVFVDLLGPSSTGVAN